MSPRSVLSLRRAIVCALIVALAAPAVALAAVSPTTRTLQRAIPVETTPEPAAPATPDAFVGDWMWLKQTGASGRDDARAPVAADGVAFYHTLESGLGELRKVSHDGTRIWTRSISIGDDMALTSTSLYAVGTTNSNDGSIRKFDLDGNLVWERSFGTSEVETATRVAVDPSGVYAFGRTNGTFPGQTSLGGGDVFVVKYDHGGNHVWSRQLGTPVFDDASLGDIVVRNPSGGSTNTVGDGIYVAFTPTDYTNQANVNDSRIVGLDLNGDHVWHHQFDSGVYEWTSGLSIDHSGVYLTGPTMGTLPFDDHIDRTFGVTDGYLIKYWFNGARLWSRQFDASPGGVVPQRIASDGDGVHISGDVANGGVLGGEAARLNDGFVRKYWPDGSIGVTTLFGTAGQDFITGIAIDNTGVYVNGNTTGAFPGFSNQGGQDAFFAKLSIVPIPDAAVVEQKAAPSTPLDESQEPVKAIEYRGDPVNVLFGNFTHQHTDLATGGLGLQWTRTYNSASEHTGRVGRGWSVAWDLSIGTDADGYTTVRRGDGRVDRYVKTGATTFTGPRGSVDRLTRGGDGSYTLLTRDRMTYRFDADGNLRSATDPDGNTVALTYTGSRWTGIVDPAGRTWSISYAPTPNPDKIASVTAPGARTVRYAYDAQGRLVSVTDANRGVTRYGYDSAHRLNRITDPRGNLFVSQAYDGSGRVVTQTDARGTHRFQYLPNRTIYTDPLGKQTTTHFDGRHRITRVVDALGNARSMTYTPTGQVATETDAVGRITRYEYDARGNLKKITDAAGGVTTMSYSTDGRDLLTSRTDALGRKDEFEYDSSGRLIKRVERPGTAQRVTQFAYTSKGLLCREVVNTEASLDLQALADPCSTSVASTSAVNVSMRYEYDDAGNRTRVVDAVGSTITTVYDAVGRAVRVTDPLGRVSTNSYDALGQVLSSTFAGATTSYTYDAAGNRVTIRDARGGTTRYAYDAANDLVSVTDATNRVTRYGYDLLGRRLSETRPDGRIWRTGYDALGRVASETSPLGFVTRMSYDAVGNILSRTAADGTQMRFGYDRLDRLVSVTDPAGSVWRYAYDKVGNLVKITDALGRITTTSYDAFDRVVSETDPRGRTSHTRHDALGRVSGTTDRSGKVISYSYDAAGRLLTVSGGGLITRHTYDRAGNRVTSAHGPAGSPALPTVRYAYDPAGRLASVDRGPGTLVSYGYDLTGNRTALSQPGLTLAYAYDLAGRMTSVKRGTSTLVAYAYDAAGRTRSETFGNGVVTTRTYDGDGRLTRLITKKGTTVLHDIAYTLDALARRTTETAKVGTTTASSGRYGYDALGRLRSATVSVGAAGGVSSPVSRAFSWTYDRVGNRLTQTLNGVRTNYSYDAADRIVSAGGRTFHYDDAGRLLSDGVETYTYDGFGRLATVKSGAVTTTYGYDGAGDRVSERAGTATTRYLLDVAVPDPVRIAVAQGSSTERFAYGRSRILQFTAGGAARYEHQDGLGSVRMLTSSTGGVLARANYEPFGGRINGTGMFGFAGEAHSAGNLLHLRAREYDPAVGRFLTTDPAGANRMRPETIHRYQYAGSDPVNAADPSGRYSYEDLDKIADDRRYSYDDWEYRAQIELCDESRDPGSLACFFMGWYQYRIAKDEDRARAEAEEEAARSETAATSTGVPPSIFETNGTGFANGDGTAGGAGVIRTDGASANGNNGSTLIGNNGNTAVAGTSHLVGPDGASLVGPDGASLVGPDGASLVGLDGASLVGLDGASLVGLDGASLQLRSAYRGRATTAPESTNTKGLDLGSAGH